MFAQSKKIYKLKRNLVHLANLNKTIFMFFKFDLLVVREEPPDGINGLRIIITYLKKNDAMRCKEEKTFLWEPKIFYQHRLLWIDLLWICCSRIKNVTNYLSFSFFRLFIKGKGNCRNIHFLDQSISVMIIFFSNASNLRLVGEKKNGRI